MASRRRAQERDFNRRRRLLLDKGLDMAYNQKGTAFGDCLLKWNIREEQQLERRQGRLGRQQDVAVGQKEQEKRQFVVLRDQATKEPTLLLKREPSAEQYPDFVDFNQPRYMRPLETRQGKVPDFEILSVFRAVKKRKRNVWEEAVKEDVQFRPTLCPCPRLNSDDMDKLTTSWMQINEMQNKSLGLITDNRSAPVRHIRTGSNPLGLPSRLNSRLQSRANDLFDEYGSPRDSDSAVDDDEKEGQVFITQLPKSRESLGSRGSSSNRQRKKQTQHKQKVDEALNNLYDLLRQRRLTGRPQLRSNHAHRQGFESRATTASTREFTASSGNLSAIGSRSMTANSASGGGEMRTTCQTEESMRILLASRHTVCRRKKGDKEQQLD